MSYGRRRSSARVGSLVGVTLAVQFLGVYAVAAQTLPDVISGGGVTIVERGEFLRSARPSRLIVAPEMLDGMIGHYPHAELVQSTQQICARIGEVFGIRYVAEPSMTDLPRTIEVLFEHPKLTMRGGRSATVESWEDHLSHGRKKALWSFGHKYELVAGYWTVSILSAGIVLARVTFDVRLDCDRPIS